MSFFSVLVYKLRVNLLNRLMNKLNSVESVEIPGITFHADEEGVLYLDDVTKISENLNNVARWNFDLYTDTTRLLPGFVIYVVSKYQATDKRPWVVYKYEPRVISSIHDSGVNGGTTFFTYSHDIVKPQSITKSKNEFKVISEEDVIYSPLTKLHAQFICAELNSQSRRLYQRELEKIQQQEQQNER